MIRVVTDCYPLLSKKSRSLFDLQQKFINIESGINQRSILRRFKLNAVLSGENSVNQPLELDRDTERK